MTISSTQHLTKNLTGMLAGLRLEEDWIAGVGLFLLGVLSRLPFPGRILYHWDSVNFAFSLQHFDVAADQPQMPGYILYVFLARLVNVMFNDAQLAMVSISIVSSGLAIACLYLLGSAMFNRRVGLLAALLLASSPLFWFYGEIALPHSLDAFVVVITVWLLYRIQQGRVALAIPAAILLSIAGGLRPQTEVFLAPLALYVGSRLGWRRGLAALATLVVANLVWVVPLMWLTGGPSHYLEVIRQFYLAYNTTTSVVSGGGLWGLARNLNKLGMYTLYGWGLALIPATIGAIKTLRKLKVTLPRNVNFWFMLLWILPATAYYTFIHMGQQGLVFVFLPALLLLSSAGLYYLTWPRPLYRQLVTAALVIGNCAIFVLAPTYPLGGDRPKLLTTDTLRQHDTYYLSRIEAIRQNFLPAHTVLLSSEWRFPQYYLPDYALATYDIGARWEVNEGQPSVPNKAWLDGMAMGLSPDRTGSFYVILLDAELTPFNKSVDREARLQLPDGQQLTYMRFSSRERLYLSPQSFGIVSAVTTTQ
jgi:hypothetical protein